MARRPVLQGPKLYFPGASHSAVARPERAIQRAALAALVLSAGAAHTLAQTSGSYTSTGGPTQNYSTAPWVITGGMGPYPDDGGVVTLNPITAPTPGTVVLSSGLRFDVSPTLSQINFDSPVTYLLSAVAGQSIVAANTGLTLNALSTARNVEVNGDSISFVFGPQISAPISGGGSAGLTKTGSGNLYLLGANTYTGGTHFNGGVTSIGGSAAVGDSVFGAAGPGNGLSFNGGTAFFNTSGGLTTDRDIFIDAGGATMVTNTSTTLNGVISGSGTLTSKSLSGGTALRLTGANTFAGATVLRGPSVANIAYPSMILSGDGSLASGSSFDIMGTLTLDNSAASVTDRVSDSAPITLRGGALMSVGNAGAGFSETVGAVTAQSGFSTIHITPGASAVNTLTLAGLSRANNSTIALRGGNLGDTPGAGVSNIYVSSAPALVGGGGAAGSTNISIIPFAIGNTLAGNSLQEAGQAGTSFVTYGANGVRTLATTEFAAGFGINPTDNVRVTSETAAPGSSTVNSLLLAPSGPTTIGAPLLTGGTINVTSGAVLYSPTVASVPQGGFVSADLNFGNAEGIISNTSRLTMTGVLSGSGGLTLSSTSPTANLGAPTLNLTAANTYSGTTTINSGVIGFSGLIDNGVAGTFGTSGKIVLNGSTNITGIVATAATTFNRDIEVIGGGLNYLSQVGSGGFQSDYNGNIHLGSSLTVSGAVNVSTNAFNFNGTISGPGAVYDGGFTYAVFNGNNTYSGGTILTGGAFYAGSDNAFGTGQISWVAAAGLGGAGVAPRTLANPLMLNAGPVFVGTAPLTFTGGLDLNGVGNQGPRTLTFNNTALTTFEGVVSNGGMAKAGTGPVAFNSPTGNTFTDGFVNTNVAGNASAIYANNSSGSAFGTGAVSIGANSAAVFSTLAGDFSITGDTRIAGRLSPGNGGGLTPATAGLGSIGTASFASALTFSSATTSSLYLEIAGASSFDRVIVGDLLTLDGTVFIATTGGYTIQAGDTFDFADFGSISAGSIVFDTTNAVLEPGVTLDTSLFTSTGVVTAVPGPGGAWIMGAAGLLAIRRRRSR